MNWFVIFFTNVSLIYRKAKYCEGSQSEGFIKSLCTGEIGEDGDSWCTVAEDDYEDFLEYYGMEESENMEYYDLT